MQRVRRPALDGARRGDQRLADDLAAEDALPAFERALAAEEVVLQLLEIENGEEPFEGGGHGEASGAKPMHETQSYRQGTGLARTGKLKCRTRIRTW